MLQKFIKSPAATLLSNLKFQTDIAKLILYIFDMQIPREKLDEIAQANDIVDVISGYLLLKRRGKSYLGLCPFHPDKHPSLHVSQEKQVYHCFSCKASGNVYSFVQNYEKITFVDAVEKLAERASIQIRYNSKNPDLSNEISKLFEINKAAARFYFNNLKDLAGNEKEFVYSYLERRNIDRKMIDKFGIGYSKNSWNSLLSYFLEDDIFKTEDLLNAGLILERENEKGNYYDRFRGRLMFPIMNESNKVVGFGGRKLYEEDPLGKYINSSDSKIYKKSRVLYGLNFAKEKIRYADSVLLVEGYMDLISLSRFGIENVVASSGTALTEEQVKLLSRYTKNLYMLFDSDFAGIKAAKRGIEIVLEAGLDLDVITLPDNEDPDSFINKSGKEEFEKCVSQRKSVINFIAGLYEKEGRLSSVNDKTDFVKEIISYISKIPDKLKRAFYVKEIAKMYSLYESDLRDELEKANADNKRKNNFSSSVVLPEKKMKRDIDEDKLHQEERDLIGLFVNGNEEAVCYLEQNLEISTIRNKAVLKIVEYFLNEYVDHGKVELSKALDDLQDESLRMLVSDAAVSKHEVSYFDNRESDRLINSTVEPKYDLRFAKDVIRSLMLRELETRRNEIKRNSESLQEIYELTKQINEIRRS